MSFTTMLFVLAAIFAAWLVLRSRRRSDDATANDPAKLKAAKDTTYHAVSIKYAGSACEAAKAMVGRRFLASGAPRLPLPECDANACECRFVHYDDRRSGRDRRSPFQQAAGLDGSGAYKEEQREGGDRRREPDNR